MEQKISVVSVKSEYLERYYFFPENFHRDDQFHLNSPRNSEGREFDSQLELGKFFRAFWCLNSSLTKLCSITKK